MRTQKKKFILSGGGTGGHVYPALAIAQAINAMHHESEFLFIGTKRKIEATLIPSAGYTFKTIWISGFQRRQGIRNILFPAKIIIALLQSFFLIRSFRPEVVIGTGGYVCGPVLFVASLLGIPTVLHESNSKPGATTKFLFKRMTRVFTAFDGFSSGKAGNNVEIVGTPTRQSLQAVTKKEGLEFFKLDDSKKTLFITGGSLGASSINDAILDNVEKLSNSDIQLIWQTGKTDYERIANATRQLSIGWIGQFIDNVEYAYAAADVLVSRAGAMTIAEILVTGTPAILVPYPYAAEDHQTTNAQSLEKIGGGILIRDKEVRSTLAKTILTLLEDKPQRELMNQALRSVGRRDVAQTIASKILDLVR